MKHAETENANNMARTHFAFGSWSSVGFTTVAMPIAILVAVFIAVDCLAPCPVCLAQVIEQPVVQTIQPTTKPAAVAQPAELAKQEAATQFDADKAFAHLKAVCEFGPRVSASSGMKKQQKYIKKHFESIKGANFYTQPFRVRSPYTGKFVQLDNIIIQFHPERKKRLLVCCHHDTRPFPDSDPFNPRGVFIGANDGGSGVGLLCELGRHMQSLDGNFGVDLVFFDGEEFVIHRPRDRMFLGSTYFAQQYAAGKLKWKYQFGLLVDMVADKDLQIYLEGNSLG